MNRWLTAHQALASLDVRPQTLYANVSRGRIRARKDPKDSRRSLYSADDVGRLAAQRAGRRPTDVVAAQTIRWGDPILSSAITQVADGRLYFRGHDIVTLSESASFESTCALLWEVGQTPWNPPPGKTRPPDVAPLEAALSALARRAGHDLPSSGRSLTVLANEAAELVGLVALSILGDAGRRDGALVMHERMASVWRAPAASDVLRRSLVLLADHELNASTFAVRVAISTGAPLSAGLLAGLATLAGPLHGGAAAALQSLVEAAQGQHGAMAAVRDWLAQGKALPGFGHPLYPLGDPRATALLAHVPIRRAYSELRAEVESATGELPNIDFALAAMADAFGLPAYAPFTIFAIARSAGWVAHALEQARSGELIRPRARYTGVPPRS